MKDHKVYKNFTEEQDKALRKWIKTGTQCFVCNSADLLRFRGSVSCNECGLKVMDFDYEEEPSGVM